MDLERIKDDTDRSVISEIVSDERYSEHLDEFLEIHDLSESLKSWKKFDSSHAWTKISKGFMQWGKLKWIKLAVAASVMIVLSIVSVMYFSVNQMIYEAQGSINHIVLTDGSDIILDKGSVLTLSRKFNTKERNVELQGDAYFNVAPNTKIPFVISSAEFQIKVTGTEFYISSTKDKLSLDLLEGKLSVSDKYGETILLESGQSLISSSDKIIVRPIPVGHENRLNADIKFDNVTLNDAVAMLNDIYEREVIVIDENIKNIGTETIYTTVRNSSIREFAKFIEIVFDANVINSKGQYIISLK